jgi:hypothetical protein
MTERDGRIITVHESRSDQNAIRPSAPAGQTMEFLDPLLGVVAAN